MSKQKSRKPAPTAAYVRSLRMGAWGTFKHHLVRIGVIESTDADVPVEWQDAYCRAFGRHLNSRPAITKAAGE